MPNPIHVPDGKRAFINHANGGNHWRVRMLVGGRITACAYTAFALFLCMPVYAADARNHDFQSATSDAQVGADNTGRNARDRGDATLTPMDQSNDAHDIALTAAIRKALVADKSLGVNAHNIKVITIGGRVTLRGPADSRAERTRIAEVAKRIAGASNVTNEIELVAR